MSRAGLSETRDSMAQIRDILGNPGRVALFCRAMDFIMEHVSCRVGIQVGQHTFTDIDYCCESGVEAFLLVNEQGDVVSIIDVRERMLADLDADSTTDVLHDEIHCTAEQGRRPDSDSNL